MEKEEQFIYSLDYSDISRALSRDFSQIFCVNTNTDEYVEFIPHEHDKALDISNRGRSFANVVKYMLEHAYYKDREMVRAAVTKENILGVLDSDSAFVLDYRTMRDGKPVYEKVKINRVRKEDPVHILVGVKDTDAHMQRLAKYEREAQKNLTYAAVSDALSSDYDVIFYVDAQKETYTEYYSSERYKSLGVPVSGDHFFELCSQKFASVVFEEDREVFLRAFNKENLLNALVADRVFILTFRVVLDSDPVYVRVKVNKMKEAGDHHLVFGLSNIDSTMQRVQKYEHLIEIANSDSLTGVKSKHAFTEDEARINREIERGGTEPFAVVVCDVNGLKRINDTLGHQAGDDYLRRSCKMICVVFSHSPVYRVGGDEFAVILTGNDFKNRKDLIDELHNLSAAHIGTNEAIVSGGLAVYDPSQDRCVSDTFERADALMYKEKMLLKSLGAVTRDDESDKAEQETEDVPVIKIRKHILIADDLETNREILGALLGEDYDIFYASNGVETIEMLRKHKDEIALLLLDLYMPLKNGREVLREIQVDEELMSVPVIMLTIDPEAELDCLKLGAADFISKPYPDIAIVKARIAKAIELSENRDLIRHTERDKLTGLLHFDYFLQYVERFDHQSKTGDFDALACDIKDFHSVNETNGRQFGDLVLRRIGVNFRKMARKTGGIGCRQGGDTFLLYCPHRDDYEQLIRNFYEDLFVEEGTADKVKLKFGVFENCSRQPDIDERFVCARIAADSAADEPEKLFEYYESV